MSTCTATFSRDFFYNSPCGFFISTPEGRYLFANAALAEMLGYSSPEELINSVTDIASQVYAEQEDRQEFMRLMQEHGKVVEHECRFKRKDGSVFWVSRSVQAVFDQQGNVLQYQGTNTDITRRKSTEEALREETIRRHLLVDQSTDGIVVLNEDGSVHEANKRYAEMIGYTPEELLHLYVWDWDTQWTRDQLIEMLQQVDEKGAHFETGHRRKDGTFYDVEVSTNGAVIGGRKLVFCVCRDITDRKRAEYENEKSREMLLQAEVLAKLGSLEWDIPTDTWHVSKNWRCIMGHDSPQLSSSELFAYVHPEDRLRVRRAVAATMSTGKPYDIQHRILRGGTGEVCYLQTYGVLELNKSGKPVRGFGTIQDITERKRSEEKLRESEARFRNLLEDVPKVAVQGYGMDGMTLYWNKASEKLYGYSSAEAIGNNLVDLIIPDDMRQGVIRAIKAMSESGVPIPAAEHNLKRKDGSLVPVYSSHAIVQKPNQPPELFCIDVDLTELKKTEQALILAKDQAEAANRAKSEFLANMSHEIRTPINGIMGMMQLLETTPLDPDQKQYIELAIDAANRLNRLLSDILDLSRVEAGKMEFVQSEFCLDELSKSIAGLFSVTAREKMIELVYHIDPAIPPRILGDESRLRQVLFNLIGNALKYSDKGRIDVEMVLLRPRQKKDIRVLFSIKDTGIGISADRLRDIFEPFRQIDGDYTREYQGAGLGLSIVKRLVDLMAGNIVIDSDPGKGTEVHVVLPFKLPDVTPQADTTATPKQASQGLRILLAENEPSNALPIRLLLEKAGHEVTLAEDGQQAVDLFTTQEFDVILMDVQMPVMNGVAATREIRRLEHDAGMLEYWNAGIEKTEKDVDISEQSDRNIEDTDSTPKPSSHPSIPASQHSRIPIIALTAYAMAGDREIFLEAGMDDYLGKPVGIEDLENTFKRFMWHSA